jgi:hypothetical protein
MRQSEIDRLLEQRRTYLTYRQVGYFLSIQPDTVKGHALRGYFQEVRRPDGERLIPGHMLFHPDLVRERASDTKRAEFEAWWSGQIELKHLDRAQQAGSGDS